MWGRTRRRRLRHSLTQTTTRYRRYSTLLLLFFSSFLFLSFQAQSQEKPCLCCCYRSSNSSLFDLLGFPASEISVIYSNSSHFYLRFLAKKTGFQRKNGVLFSFISLLNSVPCFDRIRLNVNRTKRAVMCWRIAPFFPFLHYALPVLSKSTPNPGYT